MQVINQYWEWVQKPLMPLEIIERAGRTCYKSEDKITPTSAGRFVRGVVKAGHESVIEHVSASVRFTTSRSVTHELVRHRLCAFSQESQRYVNYKRGGIEFILPVWFAYNWKEDGVCCRWNDAMIDAELCYEELIDRGWRPEEAREVLPNSTKTEIVVTTNMREWRHIFKLRTSAAAHPQIRALMRDCLQGFKAEIPVLFDDINP